MYSLAYVNTVAYNYLRLIGASLSRRKRMKAEPSRRIPHKLATKLQRLLLSVNTSVWFTAVERFLSIDAGEANW